MSIMEPATSLDPHVARIEVHDLFGMYTYDLSSDSPSASRLLILYGDNGSGKTTLLKMVFNLLSKADGRGHRSSLATTPFKRFVVHLGNGTQIAVDKRDGLVGSYRITVRETGGGTLSFRVTLNREQAVVKAKNPDLARFLEYLTSLDLNLHYLPDDRRTESSAYQDLGIPVPSGVPESMDDHQMRMLWLKQRARERGPVGALTTTELLTLALRNVETWVRNRALRGSTEGEANTNTIYSDIVRAISESRAIEHGDQEIVNVKEFGDQLIHLEDRSREYSRFDLVSPLFMNTIIEAVGNASIGVRTRAAILSVLKPYVDGLFARLDALSEVQAILARFTDTINSFLADKRLSMSVPKGITITSKKGQVLEPSQLSSGERQLLLLFCNTITARDQDNIVIVDEPELSLNVKWQRQLLDGLLTCAEGSRTQFVVASHSVEVLAQHKENVLQLLDASQDNIN